MIENSSLKINANSDADILKLAETSGIGLTKFNRYPTVISELSILHVGSLACETPKHKSIQHTVIVHLKPEKKSERRLDGKLQVENPQIGDVAVVPAGVNHWHMMRQDSEGIMFNIEPSFLVSIARENVKDNIELIPTFAKPDAFIYGTALALKQEMETEYKGCSLYAESLFHSLVVHILHKYATRKPQIKESADGLSSSQLKYILELINDNISSEISVNKMADYLSLSPFHFSREFKKSVGVSPHNYVMQQRVKMAKIILKQQNLPIAEVALECGFSNQSHLGRTFKKHTGVTPKKFRLDNW
jgi:AraC family transcriptional regulator